METNGNVTIHVTKTPQNKRSLITARCSQCAKSNACCGNKGRGRSDHHTRLSNAIWIVQVRKVLRRYRSVIDKADADLRREWKRRAGLSDTRVSRMQENMVALAKHRQRWRQMTKEMNTFAGDAAKVDIGKLNDAYA